jgi:hypothetical protein
VADAARAVATTEEPDIPDQPIRPGEAAGVLALSPRSLTRVDPSALPPVRIPGLPGAVRYRRSDIERLLTDPAFTAEAS